MGSKSLPPPAGSAAQILGRMRSVSPADAKATTAALLKDEKVNLRASAKYETLKQQESGVRCIGSVAGLGSRAAFLEFVLIAEAPWSTAEWVIVRTY